MVHVSVHSCLDVSLIVVKNVDGLDRNRWGWRFFQIESEYSVARRPALPSRKEVACLMKALVSGVEQLLLRQRLVVVGLSCHFLADYHGRSCRSCRPAVSPVSSSVKFCLGNHDNPPDFDLVHPFHLGA